MKPAEASERVEEESPSDKKQAMDASTQAAEILLQLSAAHRPTVDPAPVDATPSNQDAHFKKPVEPKNRKQTAAESRKRSAESSSVANSDTSTKKEAKCKKQSQNAAKVNADQTKQTNDFKKPNISDFTKSALANKKATSETKNCTDSPKLINGFKKPVTEPAVTNKDSQKSNSDAKKTDEFKKPTTSAVKKKAEFKKPAAVLHKTEPVHSNSKLTSDAKKHTSSEKKLQKNTKSLENGGCQNTDPKSHNGINGHAKDVVKCGASGGASVKTTDASSNESPKRADTRFNGLDASGKEESGGKVNGNSVFDFGPDSSGDSGLFKLPRRDEPLNLSKNNDRDRSVKVNGPFSSRSDMPVSN